MRSEEMQGMARGGDLYAAHHTAPPGPLGWGPHIEPNGGPTGPLYWGPLIDPCIGIPYRPPYAPPVPGAFEN